MTEPILIPPHIRETLRSALIDEHDLIDAVRREAPRSSPGEPGSTLRCRPALAVPRPLDPECAVMRRVDVVLREVEGGLEVVSLDGLDLEALAD
jgi:hypothetical protein